MELLPPCGCAGTPRSRGRAGSGLGKSDCWAQGLGHERSLSVLVLHPSGLFISLSKVKDTDCCELTLTLPFSTFSQGELEKAKSAMDEF